MNLIIIIQYYTVKLFKSNQGENGKDCVGERFDVQTCRGPPCDGRQDPRQAQCKDLSSYSERFNHYPEPRSYRSCQLKCLGKKYFGLNSYKYEMQSTIVDNGVSCEYNGQKYCINGKILTCLLC